jgi:hypothetical protein
LDRFGLKPIAVPGKEEVKEEKEDDEVILKDTKQETEEDHDRYIRKLLCTNLGGHQKDSNALLCNPSNFLIFFFFFRI